MDSTLTRPQSLQELYKTYFAFANKCQFTTLLRNYIQNEEWKDKSQESVWGILSKISDDIGAVLTDDIVNYTRNVVDINTCKVPQLIEQGKMLSYGLDHIKNSYGFLPRRIQCLVDIFSVNPEFLIGNHKNHILSDKVIKEILVYIKENAPAKTPFTNEDVIDRLIDDPHGLTDAKTYRNFVLTLFYVSIVQALSAPYSDENKQPIAFNLLWKERQNQKNIISHIEEYKTWVDKYISNEIEHPLNDGDLRNTIYADVERIKNQKKISQKFNPFKVSDHIYFNGLNPQNKLSQDELDLVEFVMDYHSRTKYDYEAQQFENDQSTQYAYYRELEFCEYVKMVMFVMNNLKYFDLDNLSYDPSSNKFIQVRTDLDTSCRVVQIFHQGDHLVDDGNGNVALDHREIILKVAQFLCDYVFNIQFMRENFKTIATKHAMRGTAGLLVHIVNDYLIKELPIVKERIIETSGADVKFGWETQPDKFLNYGNVVVLEYEDDNEYFNIEPEEDVRFTERTNARYWEKLANMGDDDKLGVLTKAQIRDFYRNALGMGRLQPKKPKNYDDICDFLVDLFKIGANPIAWDVENRELHNPIDDIMYDSEEKYGYTKAERMEVQTNTDLRANQERQFLEYSGNENLVGESMYEFVNSKIFYWKNTDFSSHVLHPFMYNLKLWNRLNNIIINGYRDYVDTDLIDYMSSTVKFDELVGEFGECRNFWKYNVMDLTGYTTRYEAAVKDEHRDDDNKTTSELTGYDGLFYPQTAQEFLDMYLQARDSEYGFTLPEWFFDKPESTDECAREATLNEFKKPEGKDDKDAATDFIWELYSVFWQIKKWKDPDGISHTFYLKWYSHLNYTRAEYQKIAMQLWYWRRRICELIQTDYSITKYCLDVKGNSLILMHTFKDEDYDKNPYLIDLAITQSKLMDNASGNKNTHVPFCESKLVRPNELWVRWKSSPIAVPAFDVNWQEKTGDYEFDYHYRTDDFQEMGQVTHSNNECNDDFHVVIREWRDQYKSLVHWDEGLDGNRLPVFFDMEQSANVLALASWRCFTHKDEGGIIIKDENGEDVKYTLCGKNPLHILSIERTSTSTLEYNWTKYTDKFKVNNLLDWMFDAYHYCPANGSLLIPLYRFDCIDKQASTTTPNTRDGSSEDNEDQPRQIAYVDMFVVPAQMLKQENFSAMERVYELQSCIDLNATTDFSDKFLKYRFDHPVKVCRNTNMVFSPYNSNGQNKVKCAFLGVFMEEGEDLHMKKNNYNRKSIRFSTCDAATRYEHDSQSVVDLGLTKGGYFSENNGGNNYIDDFVNDDGIEEAAYNSYDSNDKYVFVLDFQTTIDNSSLFLNTKDNLMFYSYNILSDAGYIPHFAYQSLVKYDTDDDVDGTSYTWQNKYLKTKNHLQFELLGLDDQRIPKAYEVMQKMVVEDTTDDCKTLVNPSKMMDDIYRVWCETRGKKRRLLPGEKDPYGYKEKYDAYFENEYKDYANPEWNLADSEWDVCPDKGVGVKDFGAMFEISIPQMNGSDPDDNIPALKGVLDEYYVSILRTDNGQFLNEKRYILPPTRVSEFVLELTADESKVDENGRKIDDGYVDCNLGKYLSASIQGNHYVPEQVVFTGTQNPFKFDVEGNRIYSKPETLQYGNGIAGLDGIQLKIDIESKTDVEPRRDVHGNIVSHETVVKDEDGVSRIKVETETVEVTRKFLRPYVKFVKKQRVAEEGESLELIDRIHNETNVVPEGQITIVLSHRNLDNIAKYHILNTSSNLYFNGSLPKNGKNQFKFSDFKFSRTIHIEWNANDGVWQSIEVDENDKDDDGNARPMLSFPPELASGTGLGELHSINNDGLPPYYVEIERAVVENGEHKVVREQWFLEQDTLVKGGEKTLTRGEQVAVEEHDGIGYRENGVTYPVPTIGSFKWAHLVKSKPEKYLDYLYVKRGTLAFKISEESSSFAEAMSMIPPFYVDEATKNKLMDLNDVQILKDYSTFVHQSEDPDLVKDCSNFNPLPVDAILKYGVEQIEPGSMVQTGIDPETWEPVYEETDPKVGVMVETNSRPDQAPRIIELSNLTNKTRLDLQFEDGELDDYLKIYTNYVRVDDGHGDFHYDFYFNVQNLFNSPFEYISSVTNQPNVLIIPDSYLYLTGDKYMDKGDHNEVDDEKMDAIKKGGELSVYGQVKVYSNDTLSDVKTIKLFTYKIYNVSDDKPKFLIEKIYDVTKATLHNKTTKQVKLEFSDVLWQIDENKFEFLAGDEDPNKFRVLNQDVVVVQPIHVRYNWDENDDFRVRQMSFDITNDIIDFGAVPEICDYPTQARTLRNEFMDAAGRVWREPYYDHWSDRTMKLEVNPTTNIPRLTLTFPDGGYNFETIYLRWKLPRGFRLMDTIDRLRGYVFSSTASDVVVDCGTSSVLLDVESTIGHIVVRVKKPNTMYLGLEHSTTQRMNGYVIANLAQQIQDALLRGDFNPTLDSAMEESDVKDAH